MSSGASSPMNHQAIICIAFWTNLGGVSTMLYTCPPHPDYLLPWIVSSSFSSGSGSGALVRSRGSRLSGWPTVRVFHV